MTEKILHVTPWFPSPLRPAEGSFVEEHVSSLEPYYRQEVLHLDCRSSDDFFRIERFEEEPGRTSLLLESFIFKFYRPRVWCLFWIQVYLFVLKGKLRGVDIVNYHVAPPLCTHIGFFERFVFGTRPVVVNEHYSGYHYHFHLPPDSRRLAIVRRIFRGSFRLITVSRQLRRDIEGFCGFDLDHLRPVTVPNVVDGDIFHFRTSRDESLPLRFLMVATWKRPKDPFPVLEAFSTLYAGKGARLDIVGGGEDLLRMKDLTRRAGISDQVTFHGFLPKDEIGRKMSRSDFFLHNSEYETFSVVCAEALCSGLYVLANYNAAIDEYLEAEDGTLLDAMDAEQWEGALADLTRETETTRRRRTEKYLRKFSRDAVGRMYADVLDEELRRTRPPSEGGGGRAT